jgi:multiple sugar transport system substrate-binding protein
MAAGGKRILCLFVIVLALMVESACGGVRFGAAPELFTVMGYGLGDPMTQVREQYAQRALGSLPVQVNQGAFDQQQFLSAVAANDPPDVVHMDRQLLGGYAARGAVLPLTSCVADQHIDLSQFRSGAVTESTLDGTIYAIPETYNNRLMMIDASEVRQAGLAVQDFDTSNWPRLAIATAKLAKRSGGKLTRIGFDPKIPEFFPLWVRAAGGSIVSADGMTAQLDSPAAVKALTYTVGLINAQGGWGAFKSLRDSFDMFGEHNQFAQGQLAAFPMEDWYIGSLGEVSPKLDLYTTAFKGLDGKPLDYTTGYGWAIPKGSKHPQAACTFIRTITSVTAWVAAAKAAAAQEKAKHRLFTGEFTGNVIADRIIRTTIWKPTGIPAYDRATDQIYAVQDSGFAVPASAGGAEFEQAWKEAVNRVLSGTQSPAQALAQGQKQAQHALVIANQGRR